MARAEDSKSANQIFQDARTATLKAKDVHYAGKVTSGGTTVALNISVTRARSGGSITENGATIDIVSAKGEVYLKASGPSWKKLTGNAAEAQLLADRWIKVPATNADFASLSQLTNLSQLFGSFKPQGVLTKRGVTKLNGQQAITIHSSRGGTLYVADRGTPYILRVAQTKGSGGSGQLTFDHYGSANPPKVPAKALDFSQLTGA